MTAYQFTRLLCDTEGCSEALMIGGDVTDARHHARWSGWNCIPVGDGHTVDRCPRHVGRHKPEPPASTPAPEFPH